jgi:hypothetical protein
LLKSPVFLTWTSGAAARAKAVHKNTRTVTIYGIWLILVLNDEKFMFFPYFGGFLLCLD